MYVEMLIIDIIGRWFKLPGNKAHPLPFLLPSNGIRLKINFHNFIDFTE